MHLTVFKDWRWSIDLWEKLLIGNFKSLGSEERSLTKAIKKEFTEMLLDSLRILSAISSGEQLDGNKVQYQG